MFVQTADTVEGNRRRDLSIINQLSAETIQAVVTGDRTSQQFRGAWLVPHGTLEP
jgi:hypothetical protein